MVVCGTFSCREAAAPGAPSPSQGWGSEAGLEGCLAALGLQAQQSVLCRECWLLGHTKAHQASQSCPRVFGERGTALGMGGGRAGSPPLCWREEWVLSLAGAWGGDVLCKQLLFERAQRCWQAGISVPAMIQSPVCSPALQHCSTAWGPQHTCSPPTLPLHPPWGGTWQGSVLLLQGVRAAGELGSSAFSSWLRLLQAVVVPLVLFPRLLSFLGTFLHLQVQPYTGRTASGFPGSAIIIIILGVNFSAAAGGQ